MSEIRDINPWRFLIEARKKLPPKQYAELMRATMAKIEALGQERWGEEEVEPVAPESGAVKEGK